MKFCTNCGKQLNDEVRFCPFCGMGANAGDIQSDYTQASYQQCAPQQQHAQPPQQYVQPPQQYAQPPQQQYAQSPQQHQSQSQQYAQNSQQYPPYKQNNFSGYGNTHGSKLENEDEIRTFVNAKGDYYISEFRNMHLSSSNTSWNWAAFCFAGAWFAYRKMYAIAMVIAVTSSVMSVVPYVGTVFGLALNVLSGLFGNRIYKSYIDSELQKANSMKPHDKAAYILQKGGSSIGAMIGMLVINMILTMLLRMI